MLETMALVPRASAGQIIRDRRRALGLTQQEAALRAGVSVGSWRSTESGLRRPRPQTFAAILDSLDLDVADLHGTRSGPHDTDRLRDELVRACREDLPPEHVELVLAVVNLACRSLVTRSEGAPERAGA